ncbi:hypothetical protein NIES3806_41860 [Microcystis aeruginosa NIES-3806]|uniref:hypothetical protein n=1 Tax=Microcystis aeruginosa TaxID=1126 RepID=UPI001308D295|nr:hypothetical protein [Microcystis aeruginosa]GCL56817.1 hypothetical protein NIES3806_41860 [Microcystis aeruginosa NIES-3806]
MSKPPISFRLSDDEWLLLESNQQEGESISLTAARLLRKQLGVVDGSIDKLETKNLNKIIQERIDEVKLDVNIYVNKQVNDLLGRIEALENRLKTTRRTTSKVSSKDVEI